MNATGDVDNRPVNRNVRDVNSHISSVRKVCKETSEKRLSHEMGKSDIRIHNAETAVSSIPKIYVVLDDVVARLAKLPEKPVTHRQTDDDIVSAVREIRLELNTVM